MEQKKQGIVYFDGVCNLCNNTVDALLKLDRKKTLLFSSIQSEYAKKNLPAEMQTLTSIVYWDGEKYFQKSQAVLKIMENMGGLFRIAKIFRTISPMVSDRVYDLVATNRYKLFGKRDTCRLPTAEEKSRFLV